MVIIGVWGNHRSGKTTLANHLFRDFDVVKINVDDEFRAFYEKLPKYIFKIINLKVVNEKFVSSNLLNSIKWYFYNIVLKNKIRVCRNNMVDYFIIEGFDIGKYMNLEDIDINIYVDCPLESRINEIKNKERVNEDLLDFYSISDFDFVFNGYDNEDYLNKVIDLQVNIRKKLIGEYVRYK